MQYRSFKDLHLSQLGFGTMRLPIRGDDEQCIDETLAAECLQRAIDAGVNYIDTAWPYHKKASEPFVGRFLKETKQRDKVYLATKLPCFACQKPEDFDLYLELQLQNLQTDHIDFYLLHALDAHRFKKMVDLGVIDFMNRAKASNKIKYIGFSFHDLASAFEPILNAYSFDFVQIQLNYMDENFQAGLKGLESAKKRNMGVMIMEPLRGGQLAALPKGDLKTLWDSFNTDLTPPVLGLKYLYNLESVTCVLSGMSTLDQTLENIATASEYGVNNLTPSEKEIIAKLQAFYKSRTAVDCTGCRYCNGCPKIIPIPSIFKHYNEAHMYGNVDASRKKYRSTIDDAFKGNNCIECGECESLCPQNIEIRKALKEAHRFLMKK